MINVKTKSNLCRGLRAIGLRKAETHTIVNTISKWVNESGEAWTNQRIKDLRQWYESCLAGTPTPPPWFKHDREGYPMGIWKWVFRLPIAKALGVLSLNTVFVEHELTEASKKKFLDGLAGNGKASLETLKEIPIAKMRVTRKRIRPIQFPTIFDMNGSIPFHDGRSSMRPNQKLGDALKALRLSWDSVPQVTFDFLDRSNLLGYMPMSVLGNEYQLLLNEPHDRVVGRVTRIPQVQMKDRWIGNPNRVTQVTLDPLKDVLMDIARELPSDCTHDQESGVRWVQDQLERGVCLAGSDLTSASDLLDLDCCRYLITTALKLDKIEGFEAYFDYFVDVCRAPFWSSELGQEVSWRQGDVLGTGPSFPVLTLTNNVLAATACDMAIADGCLQESEPQMRVFGTQMRDYSQYFRVLGDDIIMRAEVQPYYTQLVELCGGVINHSKTLTSDKVAEFAGRVITPKASYLKAVKYLGTSDSNFMSTMSQLGDQAKYFLRPKQRRIYDRLREVPGIIVPGPWMQDSYGVPLSDRYQWYLEEVQPALERLAPDSPEEDYDLTLLKAELSLLERNELEKGSFDEPYLDEGYLPSTVTPSFRVGGDPRLTKGKTLLEVLEPKVGHITPFKTWKALRDAVIPNEGASDMLDATLETLDSLPKESSFGDTLDELIASHSDR